MNTHVSFINHKPQACPMCGAPARPRMLVAHIQSVVASYYQINVNYMWSAQRGREIARPRQIAMFLSRELTPLSLPDIGRRFGHRDHTTVMHAIERVKQLMIDDREIALDVSVIRERLTDDAETIEPRDLRSRPVSSKAALVA